MKDPNFEYKNLKKKKMNEKNIRIWRIFQILMHNNCRQRNAINMIFLTQVVEKQQSKFLIPFLPSFFK